MWINFHNNPQNLQNGWPILIKELKCVDVILSPPASSVLVNRLKIFVLSSLTVNSLQMVSTELAVTRIEKYDKLLSWPSD